MKIKRRRRFSIKTIVCWLSLFCAGVCPLKAFAFADAVILAQMLQNSIAQLAQLRSILATGGDSLGLAREINRGLADSMAMAETLGIRFDPGLYKDLRSVDGATRGMERIFGSAPDSPLAPVERGTDRTVAEAISFNNDLGDYAERLDRIGEEIKKYSHAASPGGAARLTAESLGVVIHVLDQQMRATGQSLKLQAQTAAAANKKEKDATAQYLKEGTLLATKMSSLSASFEAPRF